VKRTQKHEIPGSGASPHRQEPRFCRVTPVRAPTGTYGGGGRGVWLEESEFAGAPEGVGPRGDAELAVEAAMVVQSPISFAILGQVMPGWCLPEQRTANQVQLGRVGGLGPITDRPYR
jgi:hypothetical protein